MAHSQTDRSRRHAPGAASDDFEVLIEPLDFPFPTSGVLQFALSTEGDKAYTMINIEDLGRYTILRVSLDSEPAVTTLVPPEDGSRILFPIFPGSSPWLSFDVISP